MPDNKKGVKGKKSIFKRFLSKFIINTVNRFSFVGFVKKIALSDKNQSVYKLLQQVPEDWQHT